MSSISLILPCYNESKSLKDLVTKAVSAAQRRNIGPDGFRLILVENGSSDNSLEIMNQLKGTEELGKYLEIVPVNPNEGYGHGIYQGLKKVQTEFASWSHADSQCDPEDVFKALEIQKQANTEKLIVKGNRFGRGLGEKIISWGFEFLASLIFFKNFHEINAQPKVFQSKLLKEITNPPKDFAFDLYVLIRAKELGYEIKEISVDFPPRIYGVSNWANSFPSKFRTIRKMLVYMVKYRLGLVSK
ncbi:MAG: glycosyl transferase family 2 [Bdellovibrionaceae bacterium]|nr:glycosyl transferase family 2 [Pseudobdellovibrionaceae bacterium]|tara:strand:+ start:35276 stop:36007 length:732 start_codon:yes stop_codon:yes gene_type:complete